MLGDQTIVVNHQAPIEAAIYDVSLDDLLKDCTGAADITAPASIDPEALIPGQLGAEQKKVKEKLDVENRL